MFSNPFVLSETLFLLTESPRAFLWALTAGTLLNVPIKVFSIRGPQSCWDLLTCRGGSILSSGDTADTSWLKSSASHFTPPRWELTSSPHACCSEGWKCSSPWRSGLNLLKALTKKFRFLPPLTFLSLWIHHSSLSLHLSTSHFNND